MDKIHLSPQTTKVRKEQYDLIAHYQLKSITVGNEKQRKLRIYPNSLLDKKEKKG